MLPAALLIVDHDRDLTRLLAAGARARGYEPFTADSVDGTARAVRARVFEAALIDFSLGAESGLDAIRAVRGLSPDTEIIVMSGTTSVASAIASYEADAFSFVLKPLDIDHLFTTVERAIGRRTVMMANRRLVWEQKLLNDMGDELRHLVEPEQLVRQVLSRLVSGFGVDSGGARLYNRLTRTYDVRVTVGPEEIHKPWIVEPPLVPRPSDRVLETRRPILMHDVHDGLAPDQAAKMPLRSALCVPMLAGEELLGMISVGSLRRGRFTHADQQLLGTIANQLAVALQNAQLHVSLQAGKQEWEATFDAIADAIAVFGRDGRLLRGNTALAQLVGRPVTEMRDMSCDDVGLCATPFPDCAVGQAAQKTCRQDEVTRSDGDIFTVTTSPIDDAKHGPAAVQIAKNVTHEIKTARRMRQMSDEIVATNARLVGMVERLKTTQAQLLQAEKLSAIGQLVAGVAHELNNPLTSVIGYAQLVLQEVRDAPDDRPLTLAPAQLAHDLRRIAEESERAAKIVRNLLAFARRQSAERAPQDMAELVGRVLSLRTYEFRLNAVTVQTEFEANLPPVVGDGSQLQQALLNLVLNAEQAMRHRPDRRIHVRGRFVQEADAVELVISDTGHGISDENLRKIFDPFFTTRDVGEGTGLGLSICYGIVRDHGGQISAESRVGVGTSFTLLLPARAKTAREPMTLLVAHRDATERDYVVAALNGWGHTTVAAETLADARGRLAGVDAALVDYSLLESDASEWHTLLSRSGARVPMLAMLGLGDQDAAGRTRLEVASVPSPFQLSAIRTALRGVSRECV